MAGLHGKRGACTQGKPRVGSRRPARGSVWDIAPRRVTARARGTVASSGRWSLTSESLRAQPDRDGLFLQAPLPSQSLGTGERATCRRSALQCGGRCPRACGQGRQALVPGGRCAVAARHSRRVGARPRREHQVGGRRGGGPKMEARTRSGPPTVDLQSCEESGRYCSVMGGRQCW